MTFLHVFFLNVALIYRKYLYELELLSYIAKNKIKVDQDYLQESLYLSSSMIFSYKESHLQDSYLVAKNITLSKCYEQRLYQIIKWISDMHSPLFSKIVGTSSEAALGIEPSEG